MVEYQERAEGMEQATIDRHYKELQEFRDNFVAQFEEKKIKPKETPEILNLRRQQKVIAKRKEYQEAQQVQQKINRLKEEEERKFEGAKMQKLKAKEAALIEKQKNELNSI